MAQSLGFVPDHAIEIADVLAVDFPAMADAKHQNPDFIVFDAADNAIIPDPVAPQASQPMGQRLAKAARVFHRCNSFAEILDDFALRVFVELA